MESEARYTLVGIAMLVLIGLLSAGFYWLTGGGENADTRRYLVYFQNQSLEGLQINSDVRMQGIKVGKVVDYAIVPSAPRKVRVLLQVDARAPVLEGVQATISRHLVTGLAAIDLENAPEGEVRLGAAGMASEQGYPVIPEGVPKLTRVADTLEELGVDAREALTRFNSVFSDANQAQIAGTLTNLNALSGDLRQTLPELSATLSSARQAAEGVSALSADARGALQAAQTTLGHVAGETETTLAVARATMLKLDTNMSDLTGQVKLMSDLSAQELQATAQSLRLAGDALQETGRALANPARVIYGPAPGSLGPGEEVR